MSSCRSITSTHTLTRRGWKCVVARKISQVVVAGLGVLLLCLPAFSQLNSGSIAGSIADQSGAVIPGAKVTIIDVERGVSRPLVTDSAGQYTAPSLTPGQYTVRAEATGFKTVERADITLGVGAAFRV